MDILTAYQELGSYRAAAALCDTTHKTVRRVIERRAAPPPERPPRGRFTDPHRDLIATRVKATDGRISAKRLMTILRAEGYAGSARTLRRAVAIAKAAWRRSRRAYRPWQPAIGERLVIDWGEMDGRHVFCAVLAWSRVRFVRFAAEWDGPVAGDGRHGIPEARRLYARACRRALGTGGHGPGVVGDSAGSSRGEAGVW